MNYFKMMNDVYNQLYKASDDQLKKDWIDLNRGKESQMSAMKRYGWTPDKKWNHGDLRNAVREEMVYRQ
jgi:hypothetical protein